METILQYEHAVWEAGKWCRRNVGSFDLSEYTTSEAACSDFVMPDTVA